MIRVGGLVLRVGAALYFLPAEIVEEVAPLPQITRLPGAPEELLGIAVHKDELVPVIAIGAARDAAIVCNHGGERIAVAGGTILGTGVFDGEGDAALFQGERAEPFDLHAHYAKVQDAKLQAGRWGGRWGA